MRHGAKHQSRVGAGDEDFAPNVESHQRHFVKVSGPTYRTGFCCCFRIPPGIRLFGQSQAAESFIKRRELTIWADFKDLGVFSRLPRTNQGTPRTSQGTPRTSQGTPRMSEGTPRTSRGTSRTSRGTPRTSEGTPRMSQGTCFMSGAGFSMKPGRLLD